MKTNIKLAAIITYVSIFVGVVISLSSTPFIVSTLGESEYGLFSLVNSIIAYIALLDMGFGSAVVRFNAKYISEKDEIGKQNINGMFLLLYAVIGIISLGLSFILYFNLNSIFINSLNIDELNILKKIFLVAAINVAISFPLNVYSSIIIANERFVFLKILNLIKIVFTPTMIVLMLVLGYRTVGMVSVTLVINLLIGIVNILFCKLKLNLVIKFSTFDFKLFKEIFNYSFFIFLSAIAYQIYWNADQFIIGLFLGATPIAVYAIATQLNSYVTNFSNVLSSFYLPKLTKMIVKEVDRDLLMKELVKIGRIQALIVGYIFSGFVLFGESFITLWVGRNYESAYLIAIIILIPQIFSIVQSLFATMLEAMNMHRIKAFIYLSVAVLNIILTLMFIPKLGITGCAIATAIGMLINALVNNIYYKYKLKLNITYFWIQITKVFLPIVIIGIVSGLVLSLVSVTSYLLLFIYVFLYSILFIFTVWRFGLNEQEKNLIVKPLKKILILK
ncbi:oligosaccharide flippase family protein [Acinetobacter sp. CUI P1]|nr:oligosaccharide flippase family protein [Acinetobacter sp. CUI P1]